MKLIMVGKLLIIIISWLMVSTCHCIIRRCRVGESITIKYAIDPFDDIVLWKRNGIDIQDATMNATNNGCEPPVFGQTAGYEFGCRAVNNASEYSLTFKCRSDDDGTKYTLTNTPIERDFTYTPVTSSEGLTTCKNDTALSGECEVHCNTARSMISWTYIGENKETITVYNSSSVSCNDAVTNLYKLTVDIDDLKDKVSGPGNLTGILTIGGERFYLIIIINASSTSTATTITSQSTSTPAVTGDADTTETSSTTENTTGSSSGGGCDWCIPLYIIIGVLACVGIIVIVVICKKKKDKN